MPLPKLILVTTWSFIFVLTSSSNNAIQNNYFKVLTGCKKNFMPASHILQEVQARNKLECAGICGRTKFCISVHLKGNTCQLIWMSLEDYESQDCSNLTVSVGAFHLTKVSYSKTGNCYFEIIGFLLKWRWGSLSNLMIGKLTPSCIKM